MILDSLKGFQLLVTELNMLIISNFHYNDYSRLLIQLQFTQYLFNNSNQYHGYYKNLQLHTPTLSFGKSYQLLFHTTLTTKSVVVFLLHTFTHPEFLQDPIGQGGPLGEWSVNAIPTLPTSAPGYDGEPVFELSLGRFTNSIWTYL